MRTRALRAIFLLASLASIGSLACDLSALSFLSSSAKPQVKINSPATGSQFREGDDVSVQSLATDPKGITRVELSVDGTMVRTDTPPIPQGQTSFNLVQKWKAAGGAHTLSVRAFNAGGTASEPAIISVVVTSSVVELPTAPLPPTLVIPPLGSTPSVLPTVPPSGVTPAAGGPAPTAPRAPTRVVPSPTVISGPPGVYATNIRLDPPQPKRGQFITFNVAFLNTTGTAQTYTWKVKIYEPDAKNSFGETAVIRHDIPPGNSELPSMNNWRLTGSGDCTPYIARAFYMDPDTKQVTGEFLKPDRSGPPSANFQVCP